MNKEDKLKRTNRLSLMLNNREMRALNIYCNRYRIKNKSEFLRSTIMTAILKRFEDEHPTLWEEPDPTLFNQNVLK
jgi:UTP-glucose-1-phosphate uridylyltransferase